MTRRVQFGPSGLIYFVVAGLILGAAVFTQANLLFWSFGLMVGGMIVSIVLSIAMMRGITVQRLVPSHGVTGEELTIRYKISNRKRQLPAFNLIIVESWDKESESNPTDSEHARLGARPHAWLLHLGPGQTQQVESPCWPSRRGVLTFERVVVSCSFPFGVIRRTYEFEQEEHVVVYPALFRIHRELLPRFAIPEPAGPMQRHRSGGFDEFFGLRQYRPGDSQRMIDWKHSARTGELICREMTQSSPPKIMLVLDLSDPDKRSGDNGSNGNGRDESDDRSAVVERAIVLAASVICDAHLNGYQVGLAVMGAPSAVFSVHHSVPHRTKLLEALALLDTTRAEPRPKTMPIDPTVVVHTGFEQSKGPDGVHRYAVLSAQLMDEYVRTLTGNAAELLARTKPRPKIKPLTPLGRAS